LMKLWDYLSRFIEIALQSENYEFNDEIVNILRSTKQIGHGKIETLTFAPLVKTK
jgi:hypothetical protein